MRRSEEISISMARFANVAFSDGSLLHGFDLRIKKNQPIVAPNDIKRYFVTPQESGELCLMSCIFGENRDIFFPKLSDSLHLITFAEIAVRYLKNKGFEAYVCQDEDEARRLAATLPSKGMWPCLFTPSNTTGEKDFEEFFTDKEILDMARFESLGVIKSSPTYDPELLTLFGQNISSIKLSKLWRKERIVEIFRTMIPDFGHKETGKYLDGKM